MKGKELIDWLLSHANDEIEIEDSNGIIMEVASMKGPKIIVKTKPLINSSKEGDVTKDSVTADSFYRQVLQTIVPMFKSNSSNPDFVLIYHQDNRKEDSSYSNHYCYGSCHVNLGMVTDVQGQLLKTIHQ